MSGAVLRLCGDCAVTVEFENEISTRFASASKEFFTNSRTEKSLRLSTGLRGNMSPA